MGACGTLHTCQRQSLCPDTHRTFLYHSCPEEEEEINSECEEDKRAAEARAQKIQKLQGRISFGVCRLSWSLCFNTHHRCLSITGRGINSIQLYLCSKLTLLLSLTCMGSACSARLCRGFRYFDPTFGFCPLHLCSSLLFVCGLEM